MFLEEQAARSPGLTKDWSPWRSIENPENRWTALVTLPFIIPFWVITCYIMLVLFFKHSKHSQVAPRLKVRLPHSVPQSHGLPNKRASFRRGLMAATEIWHLFDMAGNWNLILPRRSQIIQWRPYTSARHRILSDVFWKNKLPRKSGYSAKNVWIVWWVQSCWSLERSTTPAWSTSTAGFDQLSHLANQTVGHGRCEAGCRCSWTGPRLKKQNQHHFDAADGQNINSLETKV